MAYYIKRVRLAIETVVVATLLIACTPTVKIEADKPITINMNVKVDQEVTVKVSKDVDTAITKNPSIF
jgi:hypothetical protein